MQVEVEERFLDSSMTRKWQLHTYMDNYTGQLLLLCF